MSGSSFPQLPPNWPDWCTPQELADHWRYGLSSVLGWIRSGKLPARKMPGGSYRVHRAVVEAFEGVRPAAKRKRRHVAQDVPDYFAGRI